jgi:hypothetical protein
MSPKSPQKLALAFLKTILFFWGDVGDKGDIKDVWGFINLIEKTQEFEILISDLKQRRP